MQTASSNGVLKNQACPVCNTENESNALQCSTCAWYFPLENSPQYALELSRAKQQFQMVNSFQQMFQHMQIQSQMLEKISFRLDGMEAEVQELKTQKPSRANYKLEEEETYPKLASIAKAEDFDTPEKRIAWWNALENQWKEAFYLTVLNQAKNTATPSDKDLMDILSLSVLRLVGPRGMHPNMDFELSNLSGVKHLSNLELLVTTHQALTSLEGIEQLSKLKNIFANANKLTDIRPVYYLPQLESLYVNVNQITSLAPVQKLTNLQTLYCNYNRLQNLHGITAAHAAKLNNFVCQPNDALTPQMLKEIEEMDIFCRKG